MKWILLFLYLNFKNFNFWKYYKKFLEKTCNTLLPKHGENKAKSSNSSPYILTQSHQEFGAGDKVKGFHWLFESLESLKKDLWVNFTKNITTN
jgi:hypothetical protein